MVPGDQGDDDLRIHFDEMIEEAAPKGPTAPRGWLGVAAAVAVAAALIVGGVLFVTNGNGDDAVTEPPVASPVVSPPVASPAVSGPVVTAVVWLSPDDPVFSMKFKDPVLGYRWSRVPSDMAVFGRGSNMAIQDVIAGGPGLIAVGHAGLRAMVWTSRDGSPWSRLPWSETDFDASMNSVTTGGPGLVAVGDGKRRDNCCTNVVVWTSPDGIAWSRVPHDNAAFDGASMESVVAGAFGLVAVGTGWDDAAVGADWDDRRAAVWTSPDGITWTRVRSDETVFGKNTEMNSVTMGGPGLVAVGTDWSNGRSAAVWTSTDAITWSRVPHDEAVFASPDQHEMHDVIAGGSGLIAVGSELQGQECEECTFRDGTSDAAVWTSPDGVTWSSMPNAELIFGGARMRSVAVGGPGLVAVGESKYGYTSDAVVWVASLE